MKGKREGAADIRNRKREKGRQCLGLKRWKVLGDQEEASLAARLNGRALSLLFFAFSMSRVE